jgi:NADPH:quinone reductase
MLAKNSLYLTRPSLFDYTAKREDLVACASEVFDMVQRGNLRCRIAHQYPLAAAVQAHRDLEARKTVGSSLLLP